MSTEVTGLDAVIAFIGIFVLGAACVAFSIIFHVMKLFAPAFVIVCILLGIIYAAVASGAVVKSAPVLYKITAVVITGARTFLWLFFLFNVFMAFFMNIEEGHPILAVFNVIGDLFVSVIIFAAIAVFDVMVFLAASFSDSENIVVSFISVIAATAINIAATCGAFYVIRGAIMQISAYGP